MSLNYEAITGTNLNMLAYGVNQNRLQKRKEEPMFQAILANCHIRASEGNYNYCVKEKEDKKATTFIRECKELFEELTFKVDIGCTYTGEYVSTISWKNEAEGTEAKHD